MIINFICVLMAIMEFGRVIMYYLRFKIREEYIMKKVLVTGADGFIGSHLTESLLEKGYDVKAFAYYNSFNTWGWLDTLPKEKLDQIEVFTGDIRDPNGVREAMKGVDGVFHLAALIAIPFSYHSPDSYVDMARWVPKSIP